MNVTPTGSLYLQLLTRVGVIGTFLFLWFVGLIWWRLGKAIMIYNRHRLRPLAIASFVGMAGVMVGHAALTGLTVYGHLWVMLAIGLMIPSLMKRTAERAETTGHSNSNLDALNAASRPWQDQLGTYSHLLEKPIR